MLFNIKNKRISSLETEIKLLRKKLHEAEIVIGDQKIKIDEFTARVTQAGSKLEVKQENETQLRAVDDANSDAGIDEFAQILYDYVCADRSTRLDQFVNPKTIFDFKTRAKARHDLSVDLLKIVSTSDGREALISQWKRKQLNSESKPYFSEILPTFFNVLNKHWYVAANGADKKDLWKYSTLKYNVNVYALLYNDIVPQLVIDQAEQQRKREEEKRKREEEKRKREEEQQRLRIAELKADWPLFTERLDEELNKHGAAFMRNMRAAYQKDDYGAVVKDEREAEIARFLRSVNLIQRANKHGMKKSVQHINRWYAKKKRELEQAETVPENGHDFEHWVAAQLKTAGWTATVTQASGDDGVDVIAERDGVSVAVQCKRFRGSVGNKAVQEVYSGMKHMQLDRAVVISTGQYTKAAKNLASTTGVLLLSEHDIGHMWDLLHK